VIDVLIAARCIGDLSVTESTVAATESVAARRLTAPPFAGSAPRTSLSDLPSGNRSVTGAMQCHVRSVHRTLCDHSLRRRGRRIRNNLLILAAGVEGAWACRRLDHWARSDSEWSE
jgi:hypothetical protein